MPMSSDCAVVLLGLLREALLPDHLCSYATMRSLTTQFCRREKEREERERAFNQRSECAIKGGNLKFEILLPSAYPTGNGRQAHDPASCSQLLFLLPSVRSQFFTAMATLTPGVLLKLLQSMNSDAKPFGEHRSAVLQVTGIVPAPSSVASAAEDLWPSHGFYLQLSDSLNSTYVSLSDRDAETIVSDHPQLGQLVYIDRLHLAVPVPRAAGLRPIPSARAHPFVGNPEPLIALSCPSHSPGFIIQPASPSAAAATVKQRTVFAPKENLVCKNSSDSTSSASKRKNRFSSPVLRQDPTPVPSDSGKSNSRQASPNLSGKAGRRAPSPVPSKCEVPSLVAAREESRRVSREPAIVVPSRYRQPSPAARKAATSPMGRKSTGSPGGRRLSGGMKLSPAVSDGGKRKVGLVVAGISRVSDSLVASCRPARKSWDENSSNSETSLTETKENRGSGKLEEKATQLSMQCGATEPSKQHSKSEEASMDAGRRKNSKTDSKLLENPNFMVPKFRVYDRKWTDGSIPLNGLNPKLARLGKDAFERRNFASMAAAEALEEALATEMIIRSLSMFSDLCLTSKSGNPLQTINNFLSVYNDVSKAASVASSLAATADVVSVDRAKSAAVWVEAALSTDLSVLSLINSSSSSLSKPKLFEKLSHSCGDLASIYSSKRFTDNKDQAKASTIIETLELAEILHHEMQLWFLKFVEETLHVGIFMFGQHSKSEEESNWKDNNNKVAAVLLHLKRVSDWLDAVSRKPEDGMVVRKIDQLKQKICNFVITHVGSAFDHSVSIGNS
ncbi:hypothetical protein AXF42_Ash008063 [Apostasia shenzhenica]|uniref:Uncharacterized protein n=1 Tax=Apostasia shenzhenica TaxID=1088818 RepID=A0A2I0A8H9_9ASPA|nr:hypothetical protein AXF42_Ash008063 [Apostasia shenzhenica]